MRRPRSLSRIGPSAKTPDNCRLEVIRSEQLINDDPGDMCAAATLSVPWVAPPSASTRFFGKGINGLRNGLGDYTATATVTPTGWHSSNTAGKMLIAFAPANKMEAFFRAIYVHM